MHFRIALLKGDGIGPEITDEALRALDAVARRFGHEFSYVEAYAGARHGTATASTSPR
jgi:3-isopropylmalate dehydrogenase